MKRFTADFETTTDPDDCRVWAYAISGIDDPDFYCCGNSIEGFIEWCRTAGNPKLYFHNLKFDGEFILNFLLTTGYEYIENKKDRADFTFTTLITDMGQFYSIEVYFKVRKSSVVKCTFYDSMKILNFSVEDVAKGFGLSISKLKIDYKAKREVGHILTTEEKDYIYNDVKIMSLALAKMFEKGLTKMTIGSDAISFYKEMTPYFKKVFPVLDETVDEVIRKSYKGGFTYLNPLYSEKETGKGVVFDKNSMYPAKMHNELLPYGEPVYFDGRYIFDAEYPLYVQVVSCAFKLKKGKIPSIQIKNHMSFMPNAYLESSNDEIVTLALTSVDLELFFEQYNVWGLTYHNGFKFRGKKGLFSDYVDHWTSSKIQAKKDGNKALYLTSKLMLNSLYGKFGLNPHCTKKFPYLQDGIVKYGMHKPETRESIYVAVASFITSLARKDIIESSQAIRDWSLKKYGEDFYIYSDTDSIHMRIKNKKKDLEELSKVMDIDDYRLGAWKLESEFKRGKYLRQKCYIEQDYNGVINATVAGLPKKLSHTVNFDNFKVGFNTADLTDEEIGEAGRKLTYKHCKGGVILADTDFTIK